MCQITNVFIITLTHSAKKSVNISPQELSQKRFEGLRKTRLCKIETLGFPCLRWQLVPFVYSVTLWARQPLIPEDPLCSAILTVNKTLNQRVKLDTLLALKCICCQNVSNNSLPSNVAYLGDYNSLSNISIGLTMITQSSTFQDTLQIKLGGENEWSRFCLFSQHNLNINL